MNRTVLIGAVVGVHGLKGEVKVAPANGDPERFRRVKSVLLATCRQSGRGQATLNEVAIEGQWAQAGKGVAIVKLAGVDDPEAAEALRGAEFFVREDELPEPGEGEYYSFMLVGMQCVDQDGTLLGTVSEVLDRPANDVIVVAAADGGRDYLIPSVEHYIVDVDLSARRLVICNRPGLR